MFLALNSYLRLSCCRFFSFFFFQKATLLLTRNNNLTFGGTTLYAVKIVGTKNLYKYSREKQRVA